MSIGSSTSSTPITSVFSPSSKRTRGDDDDEGDGESVVIIPKVRRGNITPGVASPRTADLTATGRSSRDGTELATSSSPTFSVSSMSGFTSYARTSTAPASALSSESSPAVSTSTASTLSSSAWSSSSSSSSSSPPLSSFLMPPFSHSNPMVAGMNPYAAYTMQMQQQQQQIQRQAQMAYYQYQMRTNPYTGLSPYMPLPVPSVPPYAFLSSSSSTPFSLSSTSLPQSSTSSSESATATRSSLSSSLSSLSSLPSTLDSSSSSSSSSSQIIPGLTIAHMHKLADMIHNQSGFMEVIGEIQDKFNDNWCTEITNKKINASLRFEFCYNLLDKLDSKYAPELQLTIPHNVKTISVVLVNWVDWKKEIQDIQVLWKDGSENRSIVALTLRELNSKCGLPQKMTRKWAEQLKNHCLSATSTGKYRVFNQENREWREKNFRDLTLREIWECASSFCKLSFGHNNLLFFITSLFEMESVENTLLELSQQTKPMLERGSDFTGTQMWKVETLRSFIGIVISIPRKERIYMLTDPQKLGWGLSGFIVNQHEYREPDKVQISLGSQMRILGLQSCLQNALEHGMSLRVRFDSKYCDTQFFERWGGQNRGTILPSRSEEERRKIEQPTDVLFEFTAEKFIKSFFTRLLA